MQNSLIDHNYVLKKKLKKKQMIKTISEQNFNPKKLLQPRQTQSTDLKAAKGSPVIVRKVHSSLVQTNDKILDAKKIFMNSILPKDSKEEDFSLVELFEYQHWTLIKGWTSDKSNFKFTDGKEAKDFGSLDLPPTSKWFSEWVIFIDLFNQTDSQGWQVNLR